jgi:hypothetical protein
MPSSYDPVFPYRERKIAVSTTLRSRRVAGHTMTIRTTTDDSGGGTMAGRAFVGLSPEEKHKGQFRPAPLPAEPGVSVSRVVVGVALGSIVLALGYHVHSIRQPRKACVGDLFGRDRCPPTGSGVPMVVWMGVAALIVTVVIAWPYLTFAARLWIHRRRARRHPLDDAAVS